ncbi:hypothetical protein B0J11DRAFT_501442 [Dendryphion nanum]|uniref:Uncharacterized protein n=1 Tax=Dendryphion nanum TaxID=256645 RepID=A0A9P9EKS7_9PLEO|nr:hypothetical protein B0J11DRAFT_501442 [Dendryphion nanum]
MSKRNNDGDVLVNRLNIALAKHQKALTAMLGARPEGEVDEEKLKAQREREEMEDKMSAYEQLGVGSKIPKEILDGSFTKRTMVSDDKLLQQLIGRKAAKAHLAAKQASKSNAQLAKPAKPLNPTKKEDSEDEEEGRTAMFNSKRQKVVSKPSTKDANSNEEETPLNIGIPTIDENPFKDHEEHPNRDDNSAEAPVPKSRSTKKKPVSYLDEVLAKRSAKKKKK